MYKIINNIFIKFNKIIENIFDWLLLLKLDRINYGEIYGELDLNYFLKNRKIFYSGKI